MNSKKIDHSFTDSEKVRGKAGVTNELISTNV